MEKSYFSVVIVSRQISLRKFLSALTDMSGAFSIVNAVVFLWLTLTDLKKVLAFPITSVEFECNKLCTRLLVSFYRATLLCIFTFLPSNIVKRSNFNII